jgi:hypothetical protein
VWSDVTEKLRAQVAQRASGCCEYCLIHEDDAGFPHQVDHIVSRKHGGLSTSGNLAYACAPCNRYKGSDITSIDLVSGEAVRLFNPRLDQWSDHFRIDGGAVRALTGTGRVTVRLLRLNLPERVAERILLGR